MNAYLAKNDTTKMLAKTLENYAEYRRGEAMLEYQTTLLHKKSNEEWAKTSAGSWVNASLSINYFYVCDQFYGLLFSNIRYYFPYLFLIFLSTYLGLLKGIFIFWRKVSTPAFLYSLFPFV
jgi:hypothetical protein